MIKVGDLLINLSAVTHIELNARRYDIAETFDTTPGVRIHFPETYNGNTELFIKGQEAEELREYLLSSYDVDKFEEEANRLLPDRVTPFASVVKTADILSMSLENLTEDLAMLRGVPQEEITEFVVVYKEELAALELAQITRNGAK